MSKPYEVVETVDGSQAWRDSHTGKPTVLRITKGVRQKQVSETVLEVAK